MSLGPSRLTTHVVRLCGVNCKLRRRIKKVELVKKMGKYGLIWQRILLRPIVYYQEGVGKLLRGHFAKWQIDKVWFAFGCLIFCLPIIFICLVLGAASCFGGGGGGGSVGLTSPDLSEVVCPTSGVFILVAQTNHYRMNNYGHHLLFATLNSLHKRQSCSRKKRIEIK